MLSIGQKARGSKGLSIFILFTMEINMAAIEIIQSDIFNFFFKNNGVVLDHLGWLVVLVVV